ncbi:uncharacterized protein LOC129911868 [Episyrphus balteatus]|uniref:uncharacterized protein LOC129911868 n=1 Tax=Episyrphus balteatus TaxID=286459 RepID=UPI0024868D69|nr:uncharacterized protein LOC129911868 [Episyrphus balteatus]XP_055845826.1 uncharacterized protein LOC129911868 [Episyrphus balteatus]
MSNSWIDSGDGTGIYCDADADNNLLQLKLKKPKAWKWELTTSRSSPNIAMPRIMLFDHEGNLLVDANQQVDDAVYRAEKKLRKASSRKAKKFDKAATTNLDDILQDDEDTGLGSLDSTERQWFRTLSNDSLRSKRKPSNFFRNSKKGEENSGGPNEIDIDSLQICEATASDSNSQSPLPICEIIDSSTPQSPLEDNKDLEEELNIDTPWRRKLSLKTKHIDSDDSERQPPVNVPVILSDSEGPPERQYISKASWKPFHSNGCLNVTPSIAKPFERRATSFKEVRFNVDPEMEEKNEAQKPKRRCRRSNTNGLPNLTHSRSILERQSVMKCRLSSPEFEKSESQEVQMAPRYFLRTCRAGTLVVAEDSGKYKRTRRRTRKISSTENFLSNSSSSLKQKGGLNSSLGDVCSQSQSVKNFGEYNGSRPRRKVIPIRRHRSDGNILLVTSSEEEKIENCDRMKHRKNAAWRHKNEDVKNNGGSNK